METIDESKRQMGVPINNLVDSCREGSATLTSKELLPTDDMQMGGEVGHGQGEKRVEWAGPIYPKVVRE